MRLTIEDESVSSFQIEVLSISHLEHLRTQTVAQLEAIETALQSARAVAVIDIGE